MNRSPFTVVCLRMIVLRNTAQVGLGDLDEIAEDAGVADFQRLDAGPVDLPLLQLSDPFLSLPARGAQFVERLGISVAKNAALLDCQRRLIDKRRIEQRYKVRKFAQILAL